MLRKLIIFVLILCLICFPVTLFSPQTADATTITPTDYVSLGDSIAYGYSAPSGQGYSDLFNAYLQSKPELAGSQFYNLSHPGDTSSDLLEKLKNNSKVKERLNKSRIVTISIGGNNLLGPVISSLAGVYDLKLLDPQLNSKLAQALRSDKNLEGTLLQLASSGTIERQLADSVASFKKDWPGIIQSLKSLAPDSQVYALNIYNPFAQNDPFFSLIDPYVEKINSVIEVGEGYSYADIYTCFLKGYEQKPLNYNLLQGNTDPHPTPEGHLLIFQTLCSLYDLTNAIPWDSRRNVPEDKTWTVKFTDTLAQSAAGYIQVYTNSGLSLNLSVQTTKIGSDFLVVKPPSNGYLPGSYCLLIKQGLPSRSGQILKKSICMRFTVE